MASGRLRLKDYFTEHIDNDILGNVDVNSREELMELAEKEGIFNPINWDAWDLLCEKTKELIRNFHVSEKNKKHSRKAKRIYLYTINPFKLLKVYDKATDLAENFGIAVGMVTYKAHTLKPFKDKYIFSFNELDELPQWEEKKLVYAYNLKTNKFLGAFNTQVEASKHFHLHPSQVGYLMSRCEGKLPSKNLFFTYEKPTNGRTKTTINMGS